VIRSKPKDCQDNSCEYGSNCSGCINRSALSKAGYELIKTIECLPSSIEQTKTVTAAEEFIKLSENELKECKKQFESKVVHLANSIKGSNMIGLDWSTDKIHKTLLQLVEK